MPNPTAHISADILEAYEALIATKPKIQRKGKTMPYTSVNGHMFSYIGKDGKVALRLPKEALEAFLEKYETKLHVSYGTVMKEYAEVPDDLVKDIQTMEHYLDISYEYVRNLKPKAAKN